MRRSTDVRNSVDAGLWRVLQDWHGNQIATGSLVFFHLSSSHEEIHDRPMELLWKRKLRGFGNRWQRSMAAQKQTHRNIKNHPQHQITNQASAHPTHVPGSLSMGLRWPSMWNPNSLFISQPVDHCKDIWFGVTGLREVHQGWHWRHLGECKVCVTARCSFVCLST